MGLRLLFGIRPEYLVRELLLLVRHCVVQVLESRNELLQILRMLCGELLVGLHILQCGHRPELLRALIVHPIHVTSIIAHDLRKLIPLRALGRANAQLRIQLFDPLLDPFLGTLTRNRVPCQWRGWRGGRFLHPG